MNTALVKHNPHQRPTFDVLAHESQFSRKLRINVVDENIRTVISSDAQMTGALNLHGGVKLDGHMQGDLTFGLDDGLGIISKNATLQGNLHGPRALIMGTVEGDVFIHGLLMLAPSAMVMGNIYYDRLVVHDGAQISGGMHMNSVGKGIAAPVELGSGMNLDTVSVVRPLRSVGAARAVVS